MPEPDSRIIRTTRQCLFIRTPGQCDNDGGELTVPLVRQLLQANVVMMARYLPALRALLENGASMAEALGLAED